MIIIKKIIKSDVLPVHKQHRKDGADVNCVNYIPPIMQCTSLRDISHI